MLSNWVSNVPGIITQDRATGSGYPSDPKCKEWMKELQDPLFGYCDLIRFSWAPTKARLEEAGHRVTFQADLDDDDNGNGINKKNKEDHALQRGMASFLNNNNNSNSKCVNNKRKRFSYFEKRKLRVVDVIGR